MQKYCFKYWDHWVPGAFSLRVKRSGLEDDLTPSSSGEVKNAWRHTSTPTLPLPYPRC